METLRQVINMYLFASNIQFDHHHLLQILSCCSVYFFLFFFYKIYKAGVHRCTDLCLWVQFNSIDHCVYFYMNTMWFLLFYLHSTTCNWEWWKLWQFFYCSGLFYLSWVFCFCYCCCWWFYLFVLHMKLWIVLLRSVKNCVGILMEIALNLGT